MFWIHNEFAHHRLDDSNIPVQCSTYEAAEEGHPKVHRKANNEKGNHGSETTKNENGLTT
jgi:hypothetical protein